MLLWNLYHSQFIMHKLLFKTAYIIHFLYHHCIKGTNCCRRRLQRKIILDSLTWSSLLLTEAASVKEESVPRVRILKNSFKKNKKREKRQINCTFLHPAWTTLYKTVLKTILILDNYLMCSTNVLIVLRLPRSSQSICSETRSRSGLRVSCFHNTVVPTFLSWFCPLLICILKRGRTSQGVYEKWSNVLLTCFSEVQSKHWPFRN